MIKILITGTVNVGKTQLLEKFAELHHQRLFILPNVAKQLKKKLATEGRLSSFQDAVFAEQSQLEIEAEQKKPRILLCHRGVLDTVAHAQFYGHPIRREWKQWMLHAYDKIIILEEKKNGQDFFRTSLAKIIQNLSEQTNLPLQHIHYPTWLNTRSERPLSLRLQSLLY